VRQLWSELISLNSLRSKSGPFQQAAAGMAQGRAEPLSSWLLAPDSFAFFASWREVAPWHARFLPTSLAPLAESII
jgi:hypothetical protein